MARIVPSTGRKLLRIVSGMPASMGMKPARQQPRVWKLGSTLSRLCASTSGSTCLSTWSMSVMMFMCVIGTPLGVPVVPEV